MARARGANLARARRDGGAEVRARVRHGGGAAREQAEGRHERREIAAGQDSEGTQPRRASNERSRPRLTPRKSRP